MKHLNKQLQLLAVMPLALLVNAILVGSASAHVKWFCAYDIAGKPRGLANVLCPDFEYLLGASMLALLAGAVFEGTFVGMATLRVMDRVSSALRENIETLFRAGTAFFFISIWAVGGILLTPELTTNSTLIGALQLGIAAGMVSRRTMPLSALGIFVLFGNAIGQYGLFHLADYPVFLGVAVYLALTGLQLNFYNIAPIDMVRWSAGVTLMWASIEKWAYPEWTFPLLTQHPGMMFGLDAELFMRAAGVVEFALAFALMWTPLVRRVAALILAVMFISAVGTFGKVDLIGHTLIVVVLLAVVGDNRTELRLVRRPWLMPIGYAASLCLFMVLYYAGHTLAFGTPIT